MVVSEAGQQLNVVIVGSPNVNTGYRLVNNAQYPQIAADYAKGFQVLHTLPCDLFLGAHGAYFDMDEKLPRLKPGAPNPFIDPAGYRAFVDDREQAFRQELARQQAEKR
jgi:metallo-beta-lactamase class B